MDDAQWKKTSTGRDEKKSGWGRGGPGTFHKFVCNPYLHGMSFNLCALRGKHSSFIICPTRAPARMERRAERESRLFRKGLNFA